MGVVVEDPKTGRHPIATRAGTRNIRAENFRQLRANLQFANVDEHPRVIAITSSIPSEGKTTVAINLASTLAEAGFTVCLVDADLRRPTIAKVLGLAEPGRPDQRADPPDRASRSAAERRLEPLRAELRPDPAEPERGARVVLRARRHPLAARQGRLRRHRHRAAAAGGRRLRGRRPRRRHAARRAATASPPTPRSSAPCQRCARVDAKLLGVVLNRMPVRACSGEYGYTYYRAEPTTRAQLRRTHPGPTQPKPIASRRRQMRRSPD